MLGFKGEEDFRRTLGVLEWSSSVYLYVSEFEVLLYGV